MGGRFAGKRSLGTVERGGGLADCSPGGHGKYGREKKRDLFTRPVLGGLTAEKWRRP